MKETKEVYFCKCLLSGMGSKEREALINLSCLNDKEKALVTYRFTQGLSLQECADKFHIELNSLVKAQKRVLVKLYNWINRIN